MIVLDVACLFIPTEKLLDKESVVDSYGFNGDLTSERQTFSSDLLLKTRADW